MRILDVLTPGVQVHNYNFAMTLDSKIYTNKINLLYNKALKSYIYMSTIAGKTAEPNSCHFLGPV